MGRDILKRILLNILSRLTFQLSLIFFLHPAPTDVSQKPPSLTQLLDSHYQSINYPYLEYMLKYLHSFLNSSTNKLSILYFLSTYFPQ